jgi:hypothetical protein
LDITLGRRNDAAPVGMKTLFITWRNIPHCIIADVMLRRIDGSGSVGYVKEKGSKPALPKPAVVESAELSRSRN